MKASRDKLRVYTRQQSKLFPALLILLALICGFLLGLIGHQMIPGLWGQPPVSPPLSAVQQGAQTATDLVLLQLIERVDDSSEYINRTITIIGVMATLLAMVLGVRIWEVGKYSMRLLNQQFLEFKDDKLDPVLENSQAALKKLSDYGFVSILKASNMLLDDPFQVTQEMYRLHLSITLPDEEVDQLLQAREERFYVSKTITQNLIVSLSWDEYAVQGACQTLSALAKREVTPSQIDRILEHMSELLETWGPGTAAGTEIVRLIDELERLKRDAG